MAGGPVSPKSIYFVDAGDVYPGIYQGAGSTEDRTEMQFWKNTASGIKTIHYVFEMPQVLPSGTLKLRVWARAPATTGTFIYNPAWATLANLGSPDDATLDSEGNETITFASLADKYIQNTSTLDANTPAVDEMLHLNFDIIDSGDVGADPGFLLSLIWE